VGGDGAPAPMFLSYVGVPGFAALSNPQAHARAPRLHACVWLAACLRLVAVGAMNGW
jgi:hypothetical protein